MIAKKIFGRKFLVWWGSTSLLILLCYELSWIAAVSHRHAYLWSHLLKISLSDAATCAVVALLNCIGLSLLRNRFDIAKWSNKRISFLLGGILLFNFLINVPFCFSEDCFYSAMWGKGGIEVDFWYIGTFFISSISSLVFISTVLLWVASELRREEKARSDAKLTAIRNQINPHFLFNNLNTGISLIEYDSKKAVEFFTSMSKVFRTVLDKYMTKYQSVADEISDLEQYLNLIRIRFGNVLIINNRLTEKEMSAYILSGALQLIFENIIKHNCFSTAKPLNVDIQCDMNLLTVINDCRPLKTAKKDSGIGQNMIRERYAHIETDGVCMFRQLGNKYISQLPLLSDKHENIDNRR